MDLLAGALNDHELHSREMAAEEETHAREIAILKALHEEEMRRSVEQFEEKEAQRREFHLASLGVSIDIARRDAIRDAITYKNSTSQIVMAVDAVMLGSIFAVIYQFEPAEDASDTWLTLMSALVAGSVLFLLISVGFGLLFHQKITGYFINNVLHIYQPCKVAHTTFNDYYHCHCAWSERYAVRFLYLGIGTTVLAAGVYQYLVLTDMTLNAHITPRQKGARVSAASGGSGSGGGAAAAEDFSGETPSAQGPAILFMCLCGLSCFWLVASNWLIVGRTRAGEQDLIGFTDPKTIQKRAAAMRRRNKEEAADGGMGEEEGHQ